MIRMRIVLFVFSGLALAACGGGSGSIDTEAEARQIMQLETEWSGMFGAGDIDGISSLLTDDTVLIMPGSPPITGIHDVRAMTQTMLESEDKVSWRSLDAAVSPSGDMAWDYGAATTVLADGTVVDGYYLVVWEKVDGQWKVAADMFN